jgi:hypothetical protein
MLDPYDIILRDGKKVDRFTDGALKRAEKIIGRKLAITQGSYNAGGVAASSGTHDGGGVVDLPAGGWLEVVPALRAVGFAAWHRQAIPGLWPEHVHAVLIGHGRLAPVAFRQVQAYLARRDGLKSNLPDVDPGWINTARYTVQSWRGDVQREAIDVRVAKKRGKVARLREQIAAALTRRRRLPK